MSNQLEKVKELIELRAQARPTSAWTRNNTWATA